MGKRNRRLKKEFEKLQTNYKYRMSLRSFHQLTWSKDALKLLFFFLFLPYLFFVIKEPDTFIFLMALDIKLVAISILLRHGLPVLIVNGKLNVYYTTSKLPKDSLLFGGILILLREGAFVRSIVTAIYLFLAFRGTPDPKDVANLNYILKDVVPVYVAVLLALLFVYVVFYRKKEMTPEAYTKYYDMQMGRSHYNEERDWNALRMMEPAYAAPKAEVVQPIPTVVNHETSVIHLNQNVEQLHEPVNNNRQMMEESQQVAPQPAERNHPVYRPVVRDTRKQERKDTMVRRRSRR